MSRLEFLFYWATSQQDYAWFLAVMAWMGFGVLVWSTRRELELPERRPLVVLAAAGLLQGVVEMIWHALPPDAADRYSPRLGWDLALALGCALSVLSLAVVVKMHPRTRTLVVSALVVLLGLRRFGFLTTGAGLALVATCLAWIWSRQIRATHPARTRARWEAGALAAGYLLRHVLRHLGLALVLLAAVGVAAVDQHHRRRAGRAQ